MLNHKNQTHFHPSHHYYPIHFITEPSNTWSIDKLQDLLAPKNSESVNFTLGLYLVKQRQDLHSYSGTLSFDLKSLPVIPREI